MAGVKPGDPFSAGGDRHLGGGPRSGIALTAWGRIDMLRRADRAAIVAFIVDLRGRYDHGWSRAWAAARGARILATTGRARSGASPPRGWLPVGEYGCGFDDFAEFGGEACSGRAVGDVVVDGVLPAETPESTSAGAGPGLQARPANG